MNCPTPYTSVAQGQLVATGVSLSIPRSRTGAVGVSDPAMTR
jgi:hypothetical protein